MATAVSALDSVSTPPATTDIEHAMSLNTSVLQKLDAAHQYMASLLTEEEKASPVVYFAYMHLLMSLDSMSNEIRIDNRHHVETFRRLREASNAKAH
jgi:hypothetical protein